MSAQVKFNCFAYNVDEGVHVWSAHAYKVALTNTQPSATDTVFGDIVEIAAGSGYSAGGHITTISTSEVAGIKTINGTEVIITSTGSIGPFRYAVLYNSTANALVSYADYGAPITVANTKFFRVRFGGASPGTIHTLQ